MTHQAHNTHEQEFAMDDKEFQFLRQLVKQRTGIVLHENKQYMVYARLARRLRSLKLPDFQQYCCLLESPEGEQEMMHLVNAITTNLTHFFREQYHFDHLQREVIPALLSNPEQQKKLRIWSAGCSSGAEPYSIAMVLLKAMQSVHGWDSKILATDIDSNMLETGKNGHYPLEMLEKIPEAYRSFVQKGQHDFQIIPAVKSLISFKYLNLIEPWPMRGKMDIIFCRNVVIYFDKETQKQLFERIADIIKPGGLLYIGHSENLHRVTNRFELVGRTTYRRIR